MPRFYLAGPMRGYPNFNFAAFDAAKHVGVAKGYEVISPADLDRESGDIATLAQAEIDTGADPDDAFMRAAVKRDIDVILTLRRENRDGISVLPWWEKSGGATTEFCVVMCWLRGLRVLNAKTWEPYTEEEIASIDFNAIISRLQAALRVK
jgi:Domain of unknown function (DUF4406)